MPHKKLAIAIALASATACAAGAQAGARFLPPPIPPGLKSLLPPLQPSLPEAKAPSTTPAAAPAPTGKSAQAEPPAALPKKPLVPACDFSGFPAELTLRPGTGKHVVSFKGADGCLTGVSADALWLDVDVRQAAKEIVLSVAENTSDTARTARLFLLTGGRSVDLALLQEPRIEARPIPTPLAHTWTWEVPLFLPVMLSLEWAAPVAPLLEPQHTWEVPVPLPGGQATWEAQIPSIEPTVNWTAPPSLPPEGYDEL